MACVLAVEFNEEIVRFYFCRVCSPDVRNNLIYQIGRDIDGPRRRKGFNFCPIRKFSTVTNMDTILCHINIFHKQRERLSYAHSCLVQEPYQESISLVRTGVEQVSNLILRDGLGALPLCFFLFENIFCDR